jgi:hypothetical protein
MNFFQKMKFFQTRNVFENEIISKIKLQKSRTCAHVRVFSQRVRGRARAQHKKFSACAGVRGRIFKNFRGRVRARAHILKISRARACAGASLKIFAGACVRVRIF